jgi:hypothetical protein
MDRVGMDRVWKAWRGTIITVVAVIAVGSLASASPSLRAPRGANEPGSTEPTSATGLGGPTGEIVPVEETVETTGEADFSACEGLTGLDKAICRNEALLVVHPDNKGLQNSLGHLQEIKAKHETSGVEADAPGDVPPEDGSRGGASSSRGQSGESHGNRGGSGNGGGGGNGNGNGH